MSDTLLIWVVGLGLSIVAIAPFIARTKRRERRTDAAEERARAYGLNEPVSLHPVVDPDICIGTGSCVDVCPEGDVLGIRTGQAIAIAPASCIGHGLCERACPVEAITLVFGTKARGVDLPRIKEDFETNVPGIYIVGELGGMGLIRNAFEQGKQCIEGIARKKDRATGDELDLVIVGAGPAGLAASLHAKRAGLRFVTVEREPDAGGTVRHYPRKKLVMTAPVSIPGFGKVGAKEIQKEELIGLWDRITGEAELPVLTGRTVDAVRRVPSGFEVQAGMERWTTRRVILAIGRRGLPRRLGVPGEELGNVQYALAEPDAFAGDRVLVVGGGDSAIEAALAISEEPDTEVRISYRRESFSRIKPGNRTRLDQAVSRGEIDILWRTNVARIAEDRVWLVGENAREVPIQNDQVLIFAGGELPTPFLRACGIAVDTKFGAPR